METTEIIEVGDLVRVITDTPHFNEIPPDGAIGRVAPPYWNGMAADLRIVRYTCAANPVGDYEADYTLKIDEIELVDIEAMSTDTPAPADLAAQLADMTERYEASLQTIYNVVTESGCNDMADILDTLKSQAAQLAAANERIAALEAALKPFAWAADDEDVARSPNMPLSIAKWSKALEGWVHVPVHFTEDEGYEGSEPLMTEHLRAARDALQGKAK